MEILEGTGSMIFDHDHKLAYGSVSLRLDENCSENFVRNLVIPCRFHSFKQQWRKITDLSYQCDDVCTDQFVVICLDCIDDETEK